MCGGDPGGRSRIDRGGRHGDRVALARLRGPRVRVRRGEHGRIPLRTDELLGSLNLYARKAHAFTDEDGAVGALFAAHAAVALANAQARAADIGEIENLRVALDTRRVISEAVGILIEREQISSDEAFKRLSAISQKLNRKVRDVAGDVLRLTEQSHGESQQRTEPA